MVTSPLEPDMNLHIAMNLSLNLATQSRLRDLAETQHRLLHVSGPRMTTAVQRASHERLLDGLDHAWVRWAMNWLGEMPRA